MKFRIAALAALALIALNTPTEAKRSHYRHTATPQSECQYNNSGKVVCAGMAIASIPVVPANKQFSTKHINMDRGIRKSTSSRAFKRYTKKLVDKTEGSFSGYATVHTSTGLTARVIASAKDKFQGFIDAVEEAGYRIRDLGCKSGGHMANSKHHWGGACDFDQRRRNVTARFMYHVTAIAHRFGLVDGCEWRSRDCGHIEVAGPNSRYHNRYAMR